MNAQDRLSVIRGPVEPQRHNARTLAALAANPGCARRAVMDAAGVDKHRTAGYAGFSAPFGQSQFAITRGQSFEAHVKASGCAELLRLLRERLGLEIPEVSYDDLADVGGNDTNDVRYARTRMLIARAARAGDDAGTMFDHPLLRLSVGGQWVYLEPDLLAFKWQRQFHVVEIKSFAIIDEQADPTKVAAASVQSAVYVHALRQLLEELGFDPAMVSHEVALVCPENFSNRPTLAILDVRKQLTVLRRQLLRLSRIDSILEHLPLDLTFDLRFDAGGIPTRPVRELVAAFRAVEARYCPDCLSHCEMSVFCRDEAAGTTAALGLSVREELGGVETVKSALAIASGTLTPSPDQVEAAATLRLAFTLRREATGGTQ